MSKHITKEEKERVDMLINLWLVSKSKIPFIMQTIDLMENM